jgi:uncharacterized protein YjiS (DUF1127 family)
MYLTRWRAVADGSKLLRPLEGLSDVSTRWVVTHTERAQYKQCAPVPAKGRHRPTTSDLLRPISYRRTDKDEKETSEMIIMEAILSASAPLHGIAAQSVGRWAVRTFKRWRGTYTTWHRERRAMGELLSMSDRDLRDIGINRCEILRAGRGDTPRKRTSV